MGCGRAPIVRVLLLRPWRSRHADTHGNPKRLTLQPHTLNPSCVVVSSRCRSEVRGGGAIGRMWPSGGTQRSSTRRVVKMTEAGVRRPVRALRRSVRGQHLGGHVVARRGGWWARRQAVAVERPGCLAPVGVESMAS